MREEVRGLQQARDRLRQRIAALEEELKKTKEEAEVAAKATKSDDEEDVPLSQRKRFTRVEMARVLMERNQYKERFMELQEAVRWTEMIRASKTDPSSISGGKGSVWKLYVHYAYIMRSSNRRRRKELIRRFWSFTVLVISSRDRPIEGLWYVPRTRYLMCVTALQLTRSYRRRLWMPCVDVR